MTLKIEEHLPIWIGSAEASSIIRKIENLAVARPMTHDLIISIIEKLDINLLKLKSMTLKKETYFAVIFLEDENGNVIEIDSRPSDAIAVAIRIDAPIYVTANVLSNGSVSTDSAKDAQEAEEFKTLFKVSNRLTFAKLMKDNDHHESDQ